LEDRELRFLEVEGKRFCLKPKAQRSSNLTPPEAHSIINYKSTIVHLSFL